MAIQVQTETISPRLIIDLLQKLNQNKYNEPKILKRTRPVSNTKLQLKMYKKHRTPLETKIN